MREIHHHTRNQVESYLSDALQLVNELEMTDDLREACFTKAVDLLSSKQIMFDQTDATPVAVPRMAIPRNERAH